FSSLTPPPPRSTLFPYTTLFRSGSACSPLATIGQGQSDHTKTNDANHRQQRGHFRDRHRDIANVVNLRAGLVARILGCLGRKFTDRKSTRLNSSHVSISYAVFCL